MVEFDSTIGERRQSDRLVGDPPEGRALETRERGGDHAQGHFATIGDQYFSDQRVSILEANGTQVVAEVNGTYGVYSQTIKLRGGTLSTKCSCPSTEQPFCRHCVAVLLQQFHSGYSENETSKAAPPPSQA